MPRDKEEYVVTLTRPTNITPQEMERHICEAVKKLDTRYKNFTKEVMVVNDVTVRRKPLDRYGKEVVNG